MSNALPVQLTRFIGRGQEIAEVRRLLLDSRLLTLAGPGGSGKSRLALEVIRELAASDQGQLSWVDLASIGDDSVVPKAVAAAVGMPEQPGRPTRETLAHFLANQQLLLVLDNCEHVIGICSQLASRLMLTCPELRILATSREPLAIAGEVIYQLPALSCPPPELLDHLYSFKVISPAMLGELASYEAVSLFLDRAAADVPGFKLTPGNAHAISAICLGLDGMPLAIELAAARVKVLTADEIAARLDDRFCLLSSDNRIGTAQRHRSLRAAIDWSHNLLTPPEQALLRRLSVFAGDCSLITAEAVCAGQGIEREQLLSLLSSLIDKSFVAAETVQHSEARYTLLETIRQYSAEKLEVAGEWAMVHDRHLQYYLQVVQDVEAKLAGKYQELWLNWMAGEYDNIRAALGWSLATGQIEAGLRIAVGLYQFWTIRDYLEEGLDWSERLLAQAGPGVAPAVRASALAYASIMAGRRHENEDQISYAEEAIISAEAAGKAGRPALAMARGAQAWSAQKASDYERALELALQEAQLFRELGDAYNLGLALSLFSFSAMALGEFGQAKTMLDEALPLLRQSGDPYRVAMALNYTGDLARCQQDYPQAETAYLECISLLRDIGAQRDLASALHNLGHACWHQGDVHRAQALFEESLAGHRQQHNTLGMAECLIGFAAVAISARLSAAAARLLGAAGAIGGQHITGEWAATKMEYQYHLTRARSGLTKAGFQREQIAGQRLSLEEAVALALDVAERAGAAQTSRVMLDALSPREQEVVGLIGRGLTNGEIAEYLK